MTDDREWSEDKSSRGSKYSCCKGEHVNLSELKLDPYLDNRHLQRTNIPRYPQSVVFKTPDVCHVTGEDGLRGIIQDGGFRNPYDNSADEDFLWWSLSLTENDIEEAEDGFLESEFPEQDRHDDQEPFLEDFTTSPAFQDQSRYGNFKITFPLKDLLHYYSDQFCRGKAPVLRVMDTRIYKQEIMYSVLVHPPHFKRYREYPRLPRDDEGVCGYSQGEIWWCCQSPSDAYDHRLVVDNDEDIVWTEQLKGSQYYVWDNVAIAFHMQPHWTLHVDPEQLLDNVSVCELASKHLSREPGLSQAEAQDILDNLRTV